jgi:phosphosulfolactate synthase
VTESAAIPGDFLSLPDRETKPRRRGMTHVLDQAMPTNLLTSYMEGAGKYVDILKMGWGLSYIDPQLSERVDLCRLHGVIPCTGGTLLEIVAQQNKVEQFAEWAGANRISAIEVSNGIGLLGRREKARIISRLCRDFVVLAETGSKDESAPVDPDVWVAEMSSDLDAGAERVIAEGRESGTVGLYRDDRSVRVDLLQAILSRVSLDQVIFEAPTKPQQAWLIRELGSDVSLGNVDVAEAIVLESLRLQLRADTITGSHATASRS